MAIMTTRNDPAAVNNAPLTEHEHRHDFPHHNHHEQVHSHALATLDLVRIGLMAGACLASWFQLWQYFAPFDVIALVATVVGGYPIYKEAIDNIVSRRMTMELSMTIALAAAVAIGEFFTALVIVTFVLIAEVLEGLTIGRGRRAIRNLLELLPGIAVVRRAGGTEEVGAADIRLGDVVIVKPGSRIPVDGVVVGGNSFVDQSTITGESLPAEKISGSHVYAGSINQSGMIEVRTASIGRDTAYGKIIEAVERAEQSKAPIQKTADRLAGYLVYFAIGCAVLTFLATHNVRSTISVVIVAGACGIAAGTPLAILGAIGRAARQGAIIKGGLYLEALGTVGTVVLDKTGTLTLGRPQVSGVRACPGVTAEYVVESAAIAERPSEHPLANAIVHKAAEMSLAVAEPEQFQYFPGKGIICAVGADQIIVGSRSFLDEHRLEPTALAPHSHAGSEVLVARKGRLLGALHFEDALRPESARAVAAMRKLGLQTVLLTGDVMSIAQAVGSQLGVDEIHGELLPEEKVAKIKEYRATGKTVAMIGDGINDAPALIEANVGVAMGTGTDVARESADIVLIGNDLLKFVYTVSIARWCRRIIFTNFAGTLIVDGIGVGLAAFGYLNPLFAALIHVSSELVFILNSARLLPAVSHDKSDR